jgi:hypothetical protein
MIQTTFQVKSSSEEASPAEEEGKATNNETLFLTNRPSDFLKAKFKA